MSNMILENVANDGAMNGFGSHSIKEVEELQKALNDLASGDQFKVLEPQIRGSAQECIRLAINYKSSYCTIS